MIKRNTWLVVVPMLAVTLVVLSLPTVMREVAYAKEKGRAEAARELLTTEQLQTATNLSAAFQRVASAVAPAVVTVQSTQNIKMVRNGRRMLPRGFEEFFGGNMPFRLGPDGSNEMPEQGLRRQGTGSGVIVTPDGYILTNNHVIADSDEVNVALSSGQKYKAKLVGADPKTDLAVLKIEASGLVTAQLGDSDAMRVGEWVLAIGNPFNLDQTVTAGIVSAKGRANVGIADYEDFLQTDAAINPGNSGGPLVNLKGEVVGINTAIATNTGQYAGIGFAIPIKMARTIKDSLIASGHVQRGYMGVMIQDLTEDLAKSFKFEGQKGVLVGEVVADGPGAKAGLQTGDIVMQYDGKEMDNVQHLRNAVAATPPGSEVPVEVFRNGKTEKLTLKVGVLDGNAVAAAGAGQEQTTDLGMTLQTLTPDQARELGMPRRTKGALITEIDPNGMAAFAGLRPQEIITGINGTPVQDLEQLKAEIKKHDLKEGLRLQVRSPQGSRFVFLKDGTQ